MSASVEKSLFFGNYTLIFKSEESQPHTQTPSQDSLLCYLPVTAYSICSVLVVIARIWRPLAPSQSEDTLSHGGRNQLMFVGKTILLLVTKVSPVTKLLSGESVISYYINV
jgi:hypothetical protein